MMSRRRMMMLQAAEDNSIWELGIYQGSAGDYPTKVDSQGIRTKEMIPFDGVYAKPYLLHNDTTRTIHVFKFKSDGTISSVSGVLKGSTNNLIAGNHKINGVMYYLVSAYGATDLSDGEKIYLA